MGIPVEIPNRNGRACPKCSHAGGHHLMGIGCTVVIAWEREDQTNAFGQIMLPLDLVKAEEDGEPVIPVLCPCERYDEGAR